VNFDVARDGSKALVHIAPPTYSNSELPRWQVAVRLVALPEGKVERTSLPHSEESRDPGWTRYELSPDGRSVGYIAGYEVHALDLQTGEDRQIGHLFEPDRKACREAGADGTALWTTSCWLGDGRYILAHNRRLSGSGISEVSIVNVASGARSAAGDGARYPFYSFGAGQLDLRLPQRDAGGHHGPRS